MNERLVWIDCEMTGLDLAADALIEVAALVTDFDLNVLGDGRRHRHQAARRGARPDGRLRPHDAREVRAARRARRRHDPGRGRGAGAGLRQGALPRRQPAAAGRQHRRHRPLVPGPRHARRSRRFLHYRIVDVSSIKELARRWFPRAYFQAPAKRGNHRALADIQESIEELRYYREAVFVPRPGPDSDAARAIARSTAARSPGCPLATGRRGRIPIPRNPPDSPTLLVGPGTSRGHMVGVAQLVERRVVVADVAGSSPVTHPKRPPSTKPALQLVGARV